MRQIDDPVRLRRRAANVERELAAAPACESTLAFLRGILEEVQFALDLYGAFPVMRLLFVWGFSCQAVVIGFCNCAMRLAPVRPRGAEPRRTRQCSFPVVPGEAAMDVRCCLLGSYLFCSGSIISGS